MHDGLEIAARGGIGEDDRPELPAIHGAVGGQDVVAESLGNRPSRLGAGRHDAVRELVGVETGHAALPELVQDVALAGGDAAGERNL